MYKGYINTFIMNWQEVSPGRYERLFDSIESFYRIIAGAGCLKCMESSSTTLPTNRDHSR